MTREERENAIRCLKLWIEKEPYIQTYKTCLEALEQKSCDDAISRQAVNVLVDELARTISDERCCISRGRSTATIMQDILDLPHVNPQPKTGHWIDSLNRYFTQCSECGLHGAIGIYKNYGWCPKCGAKMIEPQESEDEG